ncbi:MAG: hypothetical protein P1V81_10040 [Planctomycetota bacterium]|nr:hypothetical protein [Planctomycetota bacterium]
MTSTQTSRALAVALAALASGATAAILGWLVILVLEGGDHRTESLLELLLGSAILAGPMGAVFAVPGALVAPVLTRRTRLWPTLPLTFLAAVLATVVATFVTGTFGMVPLVPAFGYLAGFLALLRCRSVYRLPLELEGHSLTPRLAE